MVLRRIFVQATSLFAVLVAFVPAPAAAASKCTPAEAAQADKWLWLNTRDRKDSLKQNLPWGAPVPLNPVTNESQLVQRDYVIDYDSDLRVPVWTAERIEGAKLGKVGRSDCFRKDVRLSAADASTPTDYSEPTFDQGHVTPSADMTMSLIAVHNSFIMSNMTPQFCQFNRGVWQILEELVRRWAVAYGTIYVISGSVFDRDLNDERDPDSAALHMRSSNGKRRVAIPSAFYKIITTQRADGSVETLSILLPHDQTDVDRAKAITYITQHIVTLPTIERVTGLAFFPKRRSLTEDQALWPFTGQPPRSLARGSEQCAATAGALIR